MPSAQLIEEIVRRVLAETDIPGRPEYYILERQDRVKDLGNQLPNGVCPVFMADKDRRTAEEIAGMGYERIILPWLSVSAMADLAAGRASGRIPGLVLSLLMLGAKVEVLSFEYEKFEDTAPPALFRLYRDHEETLSGFGLCRFRSGRNRSKILREGLVTEADISRLSATGVTEIITGPGCLVTALAADMAREKGIRIISGSAAGKRKA